MPIRAMTEKLSLEFPCIGKIRKGAPKSDKANRPGQDLKYFRAAFDEHETEAIRIFNEVYGDQPNDIHVLFPFNEIDWIWDFWLEAYTAGRMVARTDGEFMEYWVDTQTGEVKVRNWKDVATGEKVEYNPDEPVGYWVGSNKKKNPVYCTPVGRLKAVIPELGRLAYVEFLTGSWYDCQNITRQLMAYDRLTDGNIKGIPFIIRRRESKISTPDPKNKTKRVRRSKYLISIETDPEYVRRKLGQLKAAALPDNGFELESDHPELPEEIEGDILDIQDDEEYMTDANEPDPVKVSTKEPEETKDAEPEEEADEDDNDYVSRYWEYVKTELGWSKKVGQDTLDACEGNFENAYNYVTSLETEPA